MLKKLYIVAALVLGIFVLAGCTQKEPAPPLNVEVQDPQSADGGPVKDKDDVDDTVNNGDADDPYDYIISEYRRAKDIEFEGYPENPSNPVYNTLCMAIVQNEQLGDSLADILPVKKAIYALADIDGDGTEELLIGLAHVYNGKLWIGIYDSWTVVGGKAQRLLVVHLGDTDSAGLKIGKGYIADTTSGEEGLFLTIYKLAPDGSLAEEATAKEWEGGFDQTVSKYGFDMGSESFSWLDLWSGDSAEFG